MGADDVHIVSYSHNYSAHLLSLEGAQGLMTPLDDPLFALQHASLPESIRGKVYDVIVVDGPFTSGRSVAPGRTQSLYFARALAESAPDRHFTHIFLHDTS